MNSSRFEFFSQRPLRRLSSTAYLSAPMPRNGKTTFEDMQRFNFYQFSPILIVFPSLRVHSLLFSLKWVIATSIAPRHTLWRVNGLSSTSLPSSSVSLIPSTPLSLFRDGARVDLLSELHRFFRSCRPTHSRYVVTHSAAP